MEPKMIDAEKSPYLNPWRMLTWLLIAQILIAFVGRGVSPMGPFIGDSLQLTNAQIGMLPAALFAGQFAASIPFGIWVDRIGTRKLLLLLSACLGLSFMLISVTTNFYLLLLFVAIGGLGYGGFHPVSSRGILYWFDQRNRGTAMGIKQMGVTAGSAAAALLLVPLADNFGWRPVVFGAALLLLFGGLFSYLRYKDAPFSLDSVTKKERGDTWRRLKAIGSNRALLGVTLGAVILSGSQMSLNTYIILYANQVLLVPIVLAGLLLALSEIGGSIGRIFWGVVSDRLFGGRRLIILCLIASVSTGAAIIMGLFQEGVPFLFVALLSFIFGICLAGYNGLWMNIATEIVPKDQAGLASGFSTSIAAWGVIIGPPLFGFVTDVTGVFAIGWFALGGMLFLVAVLFGYLSWSLRNVEPT